MFRFYSILIGYLTIICINKLYSFNEYGEYVMFMVYSSIFSIIGVFGVSKSIISEIELDIESNNSFKLLILVTNSLFSIAAISVFYFFYSFDNFFELIFLVPIMVINEIYRTLFLLHQKNKIYSFLAYVIEPTCFLLILLGQTYLGDRSNLIEIALYSNLALFIIATILMLNFKIIVFTFMRIEKGLVLKFYKKSITFFLINIVQVITESIDKLLISKFLTNTEVGIYSTLDKISRLTTSMFNAMSPIIMKKVSKYKKSSKLLSVYEYYSTLVIIFSIPASFLTYYFREDILVLFNKELLDYQWVLLGLLLVKLIQYSSGFKAVMLQMTGMGEYDLYSKIIKLLLNLSLISFFIYFLSLGLNGIVYALFISIILFSSAQVIFIRRAYKIKYFQNYFYYIIICQLAIYFLVTRFENQLILLILFQIGYFLITLYFFNKNYIK